MNLVDFLGQAPCRRAAASRRDELVEATTLLGELVRTATRIYGKLNPLTVAFQRRLTHAQTKLRLLDVEAKLAAARPKN